MKTTAQVDRQGVRRASGCVWGVQVEGWASEWVRGCLFGAWHRSQSGYAGMAEGATGGAGAGAVLRGTGTAGTVMISLIGQCQPDGVAMLHPWHR